MTDEPEPAPAIVHGSHLILRFVDIPIDQTGITKHALPDRARFRRAHVYATSDKVTRGTPLHKERHYARCTFECDATAEKVEVAFVSLACDLAAPRRTSGGELLYLDVVNHPMNQRPVGIFTIVPLEMTARTLFGNGKIGQRP